MKLLSTTFILLLSLTFSSLTRAECSGETSVFADLKAEIQAAKEQNLKLTVDFVHAKVISTENKKKAVFEVIRPLSGKMEAGQTFEIFSTDEMLACTGTGTSHFLKGQDYVVKLDVQSRDAAGKLVHSQMKEEIESLEFPFEVNPEKNQFVLGGCYENVLEVINDNKILMVKGVLYKTSIEREGSESQTDIIPLIDLEKQIQDLLK